MGHKSFIKLLAVFYVLVFGGKLWAENKSVSVKKFDAQLKSVQQKLKQIDKNTTKIGFVNVGQLLGAAPQAQDSKKILEKEFAARDKELLKKQKNIIEKEKQYQKDVVILSESQRSKRERKIISLKRDFKRLQEEFKEDLALRKNEELRKLQKIVAQTIDKVAAKGNFDLIVNEGVVYASKSIDISLLILEELKKQAKATAKEKKK